MAKAALPGLSYTNAFVGGAPALFNIDDFVASTGIPAREAREQ